MRKLYNPKSFYHARSPLLPRHSTRCIMLTLALTHRLRLKARPRHGDAATGRNRIQSSPKDDSRPRFHCSRDFFFILYLIHLKSNNKFNFVLNISILDNIRLSPAFIIPPVLSSPQFALRVNGTFSFFFLFYFIYICIIFIFSYLFNFYFVHSLI